MLAGLKEKFLNAKPGQIVYLNREEYNCFMEQAQRTTEEILAERQKTHGSFEVHANNTQMLKDVMHANASWHDLSTRHKEALDMIVHKIGRVMAGNPNFNDHWDDIAGYAKLGSLACK